MPAAKDLTDATWDLRSGGLPLPPLRTLDRFKGGQLHFDQLPWESGCKGWCRCQPWVSLSPQLSMIWTWMELYMWQCWEEKAKESLSNIPTLLYIHCLYMLCWHKYTIGKGNKGWGYHSLHRRTSLIPKLVQVSRLVIEMGISHFRLLWALCTALSHDLYGTCQ